MNKDSFRHKLLIALFLFSASLLLYFTSHYTFSTEITSNRSSLNYHAYYHPNVPLIMGVNTFAGTTVAEYLRTMLTDCPYKCNVMDFDEKALEQANVVVFHGFRAYKTPTRRWPHQLYALLIRESPLHSNGLKQLATNFFNVSLSYRQSSHSNYDLGHGFLRRVPTEDNALIEKQIDDIVAKKSLGSLIIASNCHSHSGREAYVEELSKYTNVTLRGKCSPVKWNCTGHSGKGCDRELIETHRFYLAFENSVCDDYITEKFYKVLGQSVPIVLKRSIMKDHAPDHMFIAADDFDSPKDLALFLNNLSKDTTAYRSYFSWLADYEVERRVTGACELCTDLHLRPTREVTIENTQKYWNSTQQCISDYATTLIKKT